ncbi:MAG: error-prone DNA polymerase, partial [Psychrosphaera sp.]|nr:error-prone DNA polymerase [Psychrosphaera sp.]
RLGDDKPVYNMLQKADSVGVFQIESRAQMSMLPRLKPRCFYDLVIQIAIVRPGPIQGDMVHPYLRRREGTEAVSYPSEAVKEVLSRTLGVPIFQEQVIKLAMVAAGFTGGEANELRRAMARWKKTGEMEMFRHKLINGMQQRGYDTDFAERIFKQICGFGEYGFPESHSASFALLAYVSAWLKYYYPAAFYCALLNSLPMGFYSASQLLQDAKRHHISVLPVAINDSDNDHQLVPDSLNQNKKLNPQHQKTENLAIRLGFRLVKGLSDNGVETILQQRPKAGFKHLKAVQMIGLNQGDLSALASAGVLESLAGNRFQTRWQMMSSECTLPLFANLVDEQPHDLAITPSAMDDLTEDYQSVGLTLGKHPIALLRDQERERDTEHGRSEHDHDRL